MNRLYICGNLLSVIMLCSCTHNESSHSEEVDAHHDHGDEIGLHKKDAEAFGVKTITVQPGVFSEIINVTGQIMPSTTGSITLVAPKSGTINFRSGIAQGMDVEKSQTIATISTTGISGGDVSAVAKARVVAAKKELDRLTELLADGIVTRQQVNQAQAEYNQAVASYSPSAASGSVSSPIKGVLTELSVQNGDYVDAGQPIAIVSQNNKLTLKADIPVRYFNKSKNITDGNIRIPGSGNWVSFDSIKAAPTADSPTSATQGYMPLYFSITNNGNLMAGSFVEIALKGAERENVIFVPSKAVTEQQGARFVYVRVDDDGYRKVPVVTGASDGMSVEIVDGLKSGDEIVCEGAVFIRLAETSGAVPEGHSHNH